MLELRPDGTIGGSGAVHVDGRVITCQDAKGNLVLQPKGDICKVGTLAPAPRGSLRSSRSVTRYSEKVLWRIVPGVY